MFFAINLGRFLILLPSSWWGFNFVSILLLLINKCVDTDFDNLKISIVKLKLFGDCFRLALQALT